jgi:hypothetical protein
VRGKSPRDRLADAARRAGDDCGAAGYEQTRIERVADTCLPRASVASAFRT